MRRRKSKEKGGFARYLSSQRKSNPVENLFTNEKVRSRPGLTKTASECRWRVIFQPVKIGAHESRSEDIATTVLRVIFHNRANWRTEVEHGERA